MKFARGFWTASEMLRISKALNVGARPVNWHEDCSPYQQEKSAADQGAA